MSSRFAADHGLTRRMVTVMFLLGAVYVAFVGVVILLTKNWVLPIVIALGFALVQWFLSDKVALWSLGARDVTPEQAPELHGMVDRLCALADMPKPRIAYSDSAVPNAFATGRSQKNSVLVVTRGIIQRLDTEELEGVLSHELSHVAHRDVAVMTIASFLGVLAGIVARYGIFMDNRGSRDNNAAIVMLGIWVVSIAVYAISFLLIRVLSRYRELAADRAGAYLTGKPSALASALVKLNNGMNAIPDRDIRKAEAMNAFAFTPAFKTGGGRKGFTQMFSTHPSTEKRLEQLARIANDLGKPFYIDDARPPRSKGGARSCSTNDARPPRSKGGARSCSTNDACPEAEQGRYQASCSTNGCPPAPASWRCQGSTASTVPARGGARAVRGAAAAQSL